MTEWKQLIKRGLETADAVTAALLSRTPTTSALYYLLINRAFSREQQAVLRGRVLYRRTLRSPSGNDYLLRRNIHRLEKGMLMRPFRPGFGTGYLADTLAAFEKLLHSPDPNSRSRTDREWFGDVLDRYFDVNSGVPELREIEARYRSLSGNSPATDEPSSTLGPRGKRGDPPVNLESLDALVRRRKSVRWFEQRPVPRELIDRAVEVAAQAPSACNRQPFELRIFDDPATVGRITEIPGGCAGFAENIPVIVALVGRLDAFFSERDRHLIYIDTALAAMNFMLALEAQELSSCPVNWSDVESYEKRLEQAMGLGKHERTVMMIALGYADESGHVACSRRKSLDQLRRYNHDD